MIASHRTGVRVHIRRSKVIRGKWFASIVEVLPMRGPNGRITRKPAGWAVIGDTPADAYNKLPEDA